MGDEKSDINIAMADAFMAIFGFKRVKDVEISSSIDDRVDDVDKLMEELANDYSNK